MVGATYNNIDNSMWGGVMAQSHVDTGVVVTYNWKVNSGQTVYCPNSYIVRSWYNLYGTAQPSSIDSYSITAVDTNGLVTIASGIF